MEDPGKNGQQEKIKVGNIAHESRIEEKIKVGNIAHESRIEGKEKWSHSRELLTIGYKLARIVILYISIITAIILLDYFFHSPSLADISLTAPQTALNCYKELNEIAFNRAVGLFDILVSKSFIPILTAILGYIFGTRETQKDNNN